MTTYTNIKDKDLVWEDFSGFYELTTLRGELEAYAFKTYPNLMDFYGLEVITKSLSHTFSGEGLHKPFQLEAWARKG
jgi:hypothetical protein